MEGGVRAKGECVHTCGSCSARMPLSIVTIDGVSSASSRVARRAAAPPAIAASCTARYSRSTWRQKETSRYSAAAAMMSRCSGDPRGGTSPFGGGSAPGVSLPKKAKRICR